MTHLQALTADNSDSLHDAESPAESFEAELDSVPRNGDLLPRFPCTYDRCDKTFSRAEYVKRHLLSHTNVHNFQCSRCSKAFARKDVLKRHEKQHSTPVLSEALSPPINRIRTACLLCRRGSLKCNGGRPCNRCKAGRHECIYRVGSIGPSSPVHSLADLASQLPLATTSTTASTSAIAAATDLVAHERNIIAASMQTYNGTFNCADVPHLDALWNETQMSYGDGMNFDLSSVFDVDADNYLLSFGALGGPNQSTDIPDYNKLWPAVSTFLPTEQASQRDSQTITSPRTLPPLPQGIYSRAASPKATVDAAEEWPTVWDPTTQTDDTGPGPNPQLAEVDLEQDSGDTAQPFRLLQRRLTESDRVGLLELLSFADFKIETFHSLYVRLSRISLPTLDHFLELYFTYPNLYLAWCHLPLFDARRVSGFLLGMLLAVGAQYSKLPGARAFSHVLGDIVHRAIGNIVITNNAFTRDIQLWQACIIWTLFKNSGVPKLTEYTEVFRNSFVVPLEKMHVFDGLYKMPDTVSDEAVPAEVRWTQWHAFESRKRTGFAAFVSDLEFTLYFDRPSVIAPMDLKYGLPCSDVLWEAVNANQWLSQRLEHDLVNDAQHSASDILHYRQQPPSFWNVLRRSSYASLVCAQIIRIANWHFRQSGSFQQSIMQAIESEYQMALLALGGGANEFSPAVPNDSIGWRAYAVAYHLAHVTLRLPTSVFLALAGRISRQRALEAHSKILDHMKRNPVSARSMALHAGQALRRLRDSSSENGVEVFELLISGLVLFMYSTMSIEADAAVQGFASALTIDLDCQQASAMEVAFVHNGGSCSLRGDIQLSSPDAPRRVLAYTADLMERRRCWDIRLAFIRILRRMADNGGIPSSAGPSDATTC